MVRIPSLDPANATGRAKELLDATEKQLGRSPNLYRSMAQSPAALDGYLSMRAALTKGVLSAKMRERVALLTAAINDCAYCVSAHRFRGAKIGLTQPELDAIQKGQADDPRDAAALAFVDTLLQRRGMIGNDDFAAVKAHGWTDEEIGELIAHVALNVFSNYFNHVATPELDFPAAAVAR